MLVLQLIYCRLSGNISNSVVACDWRITKFSRGNRETYDEEASHTHNITKNICHYINKINDLTLWAASTLRLLSPKGVHKIQNEVEDPVGGSSKDHDLGTSLDKMN